MTHYKYLFIGGGIASLTAVKKLREGSEESIAIVTNESHLPYKRTHLSKKLTGNEIDNDFELVAKSWYEENQINLIYDEAVAIDAKENRVTLIDGQTVHYDFLIIATGLRPMVPLISGIDPSNILVLRRISHANKIIRALDEAENILVIGGGVEGVEIASQMTLLEKKVTLIDQKQAIMGRNLSPKYSGLLETIMQDQGVTTLTASQITSGVKSENGYKLLINNKQHHFDLIIAAIGALPNTQLAESCKLEVSHGIVTNQYLQTSIPNIYAAGDVADVPAHRNHHLWHQAEYMGEIVAANLLGTPTPYEHKLFRLKAEVFNTFVFSLNIEAQNEPNCKIVEDESGNKLRRLYLINNIVSGIEMINDGENAKLYQKAVWERWSLEKLREMISW
ncbi:MAG: FAD-dependent oxidoreductase [Breznakibacter sp.]|nr:FAD-dependent oxidoreductase [Breznakibacter sp.]